MPALSYVSDQPVEWLPFDLVPSLAPVSWDQSERIDVLDVASMFKRSLRKQLQAWQTPDTLRWKPRRPCILYNLCLFHSFMNKVKYHLSQVDFSPNTCPPLPTHSSFYSILCVLLSDVLPSHLNRITSFYLICETAKYELSESLPCPQDISELSEKKYSINSC